MQKTNHSRKPLKWAIVGPGQIAHSFVEDMSHVKSRPMEVVAALSQNAAEAQQFAVQYNIPYYFDDLDKMLNESQPDIVYIATPHSSHFKLARRCLQYGVPVLCEKPFALNEKQGKILVQTARGKKTFFMEGMWIRFLPVITQIKALLSQNILGNLNALEADMSYRAPKDQQNRFYNPALGGGSLLDLGIYPVYLALLLLGMPDKIKATALLYKDSIDQNCACLFEYQSGPYAILESSIINDTRNEALVYGDKGRLIIKKPWNEKPGALIVALYDRQEVKYPCQWPGRGFQYEMEEVVHCLDQGMVESPLHNHETSLNLLHLLDKIRAQTGIRYPSERTSAF